MAHHRGLPRQIDSNVKPTAMRADRLQNEREFRACAPDIVGLVYGGARPQLLGATKPNASAPMSAPASEGASGIRRPAAVCCAAAKPNLAAT